MRIGTIVTEVPRAQGAARPTRAEVIEIMEKATLLGADQWLVVEVDSQKDAGAFASALKSHKHAAKQRGVTLYVGRKGSYVVRDTNGATPHE